MLGKPAVRSYWIHKLRLLYHNSFQMILKVIKIILKNNTHIRYVTVMSIFRTVEFKLTLKCMAL